METVGVYLKREREAKNISLSEVSRLTKISKFYLDYIEQDNFEKLPQGPYIKGYISSYSRFIGSNVDQVLELYDALNKKEDDPGPPADNRRACVFNSYCSVLRDRTRTSFKAMATTLRDNTARLKASAPFQKAIVIPFKTPTSSPERQMDSAASRLLQVKRNLLALAANVRRLRWRTGLHAGLALIGAGILVLAGVGFYHLFIFDEYPAQPNRAAGKMQQAASAAIARAKAPLPTAISDRSRTAPNQKARRVMGSSPASPPVEQKATQPPAADATRRSTPPMPGAQASQSLQPSGSAVAVSVLKASVCAAIEDRLPAGVNTAFPADVQRVYVWSQIKAQKFPTKIRHIYYFNGRKISDVALNVRSSFWRTWSYKSIANEHYRGQWRVDIAAADGKVLRRLYFKIK